MCCILPVSTIVTHLARLATGMGSPHVRTLGIDSAGPAGVLSQAEPPSVWVCAHCVNVRLPAASFLLPRGRVVGLGSPQCVCNHCVCLRLPPARFLLSPPLSSWARPPSVLACTHCVSLRLQCRAALTNASHWMLRRATSQHGRLPLLAASAPRGHLRRCLGAGQLGTTLIRTS